MTSLVFWLLQSSAQQSTDPYSKFPDAVKNFDRWVVWKREDREGKPTKVPYNPKTGVRADTTNSGTWSDYATALSNAANYDGIGFVIAEPHCGIDLDKCRDPKTGQIEEWAMDIVREVSSYTEISPSGTGVHIWVRGNLPIGRRRAGRVEMYDKNRYFTITGNHLSDTPPNIESRDLTSLQSRIEILDPQSRKPPQSATAHQNSGTMGDLMAGNWSGYPSQSEADLALCTHLARKHNCDPGKIDAEFRNSGLCREKWERGDYRDRTIQKAIESVSSASSLQIQHQAGVAPTTVAWRSTFKSYAQLDAGNPDFLIDNFLPEGITFVGGLPGAGKTWFALSIAKALVTGGRFLGHYDVPTTVPVIYLIPEVGERAFRWRLEKMRLTTAGDSFICRTLKDGAYKLDEPNLIAAVREMKPAVILDTAIRFSSAENENSATDNQQFTNGMHSLLREGAKAVIGIHHAIKSSGSDKPTLENSLRGSGDLGAVCDAVWALQCKEPQQLDVRVSCVKARDFETPYPFRIMGRPFINEKGDFALIDESRSGETEKEDFGRFVEQNPHATYRQIKDVLGMSISKVKERAEGWGWKKNGSVWERIPDTLDVFCSCSSFPL